MSCAFSKDLKGMICPYIDLEIVKDAYSLQEGDSVEFLVDDPMAQNSIREEFGDKEEFSLEIVSVEDFWKIKIGKKG